MRAHISPVCGVKLQRIGLEVQLITAVLIRPNRVYQLPVSCLHPSVEEEAEGGGGGGGFHAQQHFGK